MPLSAEDRLEIMELTVKYNEAINHYRAEEWADLFTDDGVCVAGEFRTIVGRQQLIDYARRSEESKRQRRNFTSVPIIVGDGDRARLSMYVFAFDIANGVQVAVVGEYDDTVVKIDGKWKFKSRNIKLFPQTGFKP
jgi:hypothetical protein